MRSRLRWIEGAALAVLIAPAASLATAQEPLSAVEWLNTLPPEITAISPDLAPDVPLNEPAVTDGATVPEVSVAPLGAVQRDAVGLLPSHVTGLPETLWAASDQADVVRRLARLSPESLPALQALGYTLLLAEATPPKGAGDDAAFLSARIAALRRFGAVEPALALLDRAGPQVPSLFDLWFELTLLNDEDHRACAALVQDPALTKDFATRIYCAAKAGDWQMAALTYETAAPLNLISPREKILLAQYLDPELIEGQPPLAPSISPTPLEFRLWEAAGTPLPTGQLPRAYAMADLRDVAGWKAQIEAAERLAASGAIAETRLLQLYTDRRPAASGGVWERARAVQALDLALTAGEDAAVYSALSAAWEEMQAAGLEVPFARMFAEALLPFQTAEAPALLTRVLFLSPDYELAAQNAPESLAFLTGIAQGDVSVALAENATEEAIAQGFTSATPGQPSAALLKEGKLGEAILAALTDLATTRPGETLKLSQALATLRSVGLEDTARRTALQLLILDRRG